MTQGEVAQAAQTSTDFLSKLERGLNSPSIETFVALARALSLDPSEVLQLPSHRANVTSERHELEARASYLIDELDDRTLGALLEIGTTLLRRTG